MPDGARGRAGRCATLELPPEDAQAAARLSVPLGQAAAASCSISTKATCRRRIARSSSPGCRTFVTGARHPRRADLREDRARDRAARSGRRRGVHGGSRAAANPGSIASSAPATICSATSRSSRSARTRCRAWSIPRGTRAQHAAGEIHTDIQRGFIRAEVVPLRASARARHARRLPRSRRAAPRGQGIHRPRRRRDQLPPRHVIRFDGSERRRVSQRPRARPSRVRSATAPEPARMPVTHGRRLRGAGAVRARRRRSARARADARAASPRLRRRAGQRALQVVSEGGDPAARGGVAAARPEREQRPADRSGDRARSSRPISSGTRTRSRG